MKENFLDYIKTNKLKFDGSHGAVLIEKGVSAEDTALIASINGELMESIHRDYIECGSNVIVTNTFPLTSSKNIDLNEYEDIITTSLKVAKKAIGEKNVYLALDIGPCGEILTRKKTDLIQKVSEKYALMGKIAQESGICDLIMLETFGSLFELNLAVETIRDVCSLPLAVSMSFAKSGRSWLGDSIKDYAEFVNTVKPTLCGMNCTITPGDMYENVKLLLSLTNIPIFAQPNRGNPKLIDGKNVYPLTPEQYASDTNKILDLGIIGVGGCCGADKQCMELIHL